MLTYAQAREAVLAALVAECGCRPEDLATPGVRIVERPADPLAHPLARKYPPRQPSVLAASLGNGAVVSASRQVLPSIIRCLDGATRDELFDAAHLTGAGRVLEPWGLHMAGPYPKLLCGADTLRDRPCPDGYRISVERGADHTLLAGVDPVRWPNTRARYPDPNRPTVLLARAWQGPELVGVATASADSDLLWQIGIDVAAEHRGLGIGTALTSALARWTLEAGSVPFYSVAAGNLTSFHTALAAGFRFTWIEAYSIMRRP